MSRTLFALAISLSICGPSAFSQTADNTVINLVKLYNLQDSEGKRGVFSSPQTWLDVIALRSPAPTTTGTTSAVSSLKASVTQSRTDQQTTAPAGTTNTTSPVSKGSVSSLLSFAEEYGGLTQSVSGSVTTVQGNIANLIKAANTKDYERSFSFGADHAFFRALSKASLSIALNTGTTGSSTSSSIQPSTFSGANAHVDLVNYRDPRDRHWDNEWELLRNGEGAALQTEVDKEVASLKGTAYDAWRRRTLKALTDLAAYEAATTDTQENRDKKISTALQGILDDFSTLDKVPQAALKARLAAYSKEKQTITDLINQSPVFSFEYAFTNQAAIQLPKSTTQTYSLGTTAPDLSNFNLIFAGPLSRKGGTQITANASATLFTSASPQLHLTPIRDYRAAVEVDLPIGALASIAKSTVSLSALFEGLRQEPLGQQIAVNGVSITSRGNVLLGQLKWNFPVGTSGITFPVSLTTSNRTELIKETNVRGTIGVSYNLDSLFSRQQQ